MAKLWSTGAKMMCFLNPTREAEAVALVSRFSDAYQGVTVQVLLCFYYFQSFIIHSVSFLFNGFRRLARTFWKRFRKVNLERQVVKKLTISKPFVTNACPTPSTFFLVNKLLPPRITIIRWRKYWQITSLIWQLKTEPIEIHLIQYEEHSKVSTSMRKKLGIWFLAEAVSLLSLLWSFYFGRVRRKQTSEAEILLSSALTLKVRDFFTFRMLESHTPAMEQLFVLFCLFFFSSTVTSPLCALAGSESQNNRFWNQYIFLS